MMNYMHTHSVHDQDMGRWQQEIAPLRASKRAKWKGCLINQSGERQIVRWTPASIDVQGAKTNFITKLNDQRKGCRRVASEWLPVLSISSRDDMHKHMAEQYCVNLAAPRGARLIASGCSQEEVERLVTGQILRNHTGNHTPHRHAIRVPTGAGEPVRT